MKKFFILIAVIALACSASAQEVKEKATQTPKSPEIAQLQLANQLAKYGYEVESPTALIEAARIMVETPTQQFDGQYTRGEGKDVAAPNGNSAITPEQLLADARKMADGDKTVLALADQVNPNTVTRGAVNGPRRGSYYIYGGTADTYVVAFKKGVLAEVAVAGAGNSDLDLYIYDENGNIITYDEDYSDDCYVSWYPRWTGNYVIRVINRGSYTNAYTIVTN